MQLKLAMDIERDGPAKYVGEAMTRSFGQILLAQDSEHPLENPLQGLPPMTILRDAVTDSGAVLLRDFAPTKEDFDRFALDPRDVFVAHPGTASGGREKATATTATVDNGALPFPWHCELGYAPFPPDLVLFYCDHPARTGGETFLSDGCGIFDRLSPSTRRFVETMRVAYTYVRRPDAFPVAFCGAKTSEEVERNLRALASALPPGDHLEWEWLPEGVRLRFTTTMLTRTKGQRRAFCNQVIFQVRRGGPMTMEDGFAVPEEVVAEVEGLANDHAYAVEWRPGDLVCVDNSRVMHARGDVTDPARRVLARVCYSGW